MLNNASSSEWLLIVWILFFYYYMNTVLLNQQQQHHYYQQRPVFGVLFIILRTFRCDSNAKCVYAVYEAEYMIFKHDFSTCVEKQLWIARSTNILHVIRSILSHSLGILSILFYFISFLSALFPHYTQKNLANAAIFQCLLRTSFLLSMIWFYLKLASDRL